MLRSFVAISTKIAELRNDMSYECILSKLYFDLSQKRGTAKCAEHYNGCFTLPLQNLFGVLYCPISI